MTNGNGDDDISLDDVDYSHRRRVGGTRTGFQTSGLYGTVAGAFDHAAGSVDEAFGRQFDDQQGGGLIDGFLSATPFVNQSESTTERQAEQGIIDDPEYQDSGSDDSQSNDNSNGEFDRSGTPTTGDDQQSEDEEQEGGMLQGDSRKTLAMVGGAIAVGGYALTKMGNSNNERSVPSTGRTTARERGAASRSNRGNNGN